jgi:hypothetical protein
LHEVHVSCPKLCFAIDSFISEPSSGNVGIGGDPSNGGDRAGGQTGRQQSSGPALALWPDTHNREVETTVRRRENMNCAFEGLCQNAEFHMQVAEIRQDGAS